MTRILMTSFWKARRFESDPRVQILSCARWQPRGFNYTELVGSAPLDGDGEAILVRHFDTPEMYWNGLRDMYAEWLDEDEEAAGTLALTDYVVLACWCPRTRKAREQLDRYGSFICHTGPLGEALTEAGYDVVFDEDRKERMWRP